MDFFVSALNTQVALLCYYQPFSDDPSQIANTDMSRFERDPEDYVWLQEALGGLESDIDKVRKLIKTLEEPETTDDQRLYALEGIQYYVEDLDVANGA